MYNKRLNSAAPDHGGDRGVHAGGVPATRQDRNPFHDLLPRRAPLWSILSPPLSPGFVPSSGHLRLHLSCPEWPSVSKKQSTRHVDEGTERTEGTGSTEGAEGAESTGGAGVQGRRHRPRAVAVRRARSIIRQYAHVSVVVVWPQASHSFSSTPSVWAARKAGRPFLRKPK